ncbi:hypothetical protein [Prochlorothrix hollandica]|nr:hypothetical protein [Prochlorothrix hollandica]
MNLIILISALAVAGLIFVWVLNILKATLSTALVVAFIVAALYIIVGVGPQELLGVLLSLPQTLMDLVLGR